MGEIKLMNSQGYHYEMQNILRFSTIKESPLYLKLSNEHVQCGVCERRCMIAPSKMGFCCTKMNIEGRLYSTAYGDISALESRPIEIKPFFHYYPGSTALTFSTFGCNFRCPWCQNYHLSREKPDPEQSDPISPERIVETALKHGDKGLCVSFQEPTLLFEYCLDVFPLAKERGLYCCFVSNGYQTPDALQMLAKVGLDGLKIDIKGDDEVYEKYCREIDVEKIWRNAEEAKAIGMHVELVNLVIADVNDDDECISDIIEKHLRHLGPEVPLHFTRYHPAYEFHNPPTKVIILEKAYQTAKKAGILYPYLGNVPGHRYENTYCPNCGEILIKRFGHSMIENKIDREKKCPKCGLKIPIFG